jgi:hypothetical protein
MAGAIGPVDRSTRSEEALTGHPKHASRGGFEGVHHAAASSVAVVALGPAEYVVRRGVPPSIAENLRKDDQEASPDDLGTGL